MFYLYIMSNLTNNEDIKFVYNEKSYENLNAAQKEGAIIFGEDGSLHVNTKEFIPAGAKFTDTIPTPEEIVALFLKGAQGKQGLEGFQGVNGNRGIQGNQGSVGEQGKQGNQEKQCQKIKKRLCSISQHSLFCCCYAIACLCLSAIVCFVYDRFLHEASCLTTFIFVFGLQHIPQLLP